VGYIGDMVETAPDTASRFDATVDDYVQHRPDYPDALVHWLRAVSAIVPPAVVVDLGAGTGISARRWARHGYAVTGVEPNVRMRAAAELAGAASYRGGTSTATALPDAHASMVIACQAFHWFDLVPTLREIDRILRPGGWAMAAWNFRDTDTPQMDGYDALLRTHSTEYRRMAHGPKRLAELQALPGAVTADVANAQHLDRPGLRGRANSASYVQRGVADRPAFEAALDALFDAHAGDDGIFHFAYRTRAVAWPRRP